MLEPLMSNAAYLRRRAAAEYLRQRWGIPCSEKTLAKLACVGGGPAYHRFGRIPLYTVADLDEFAQAKISKPVRSTSEYGVDRLMAVLRSYNDVPKNRNGPRYGGGNRE